MNLKIDVQESNKCRGTALLDAFCKPLVKNAHLICEIDGSGFVKYETHLLLYFNILRDSAAEMTISEFLLYICIKALSWGIYILI